MHNFLWFFDVKMNGISLATVSRPNDWDCSKAEWGDEMGDAPRASTPRRRLNFVFLFLRFFSFGYYDKNLYGEKITNIRIKINANNMRRTCCPPPTKASGVSTTPLCTTPVRSHSRSAAKSWLVRKQSSSSSRTPWKSKGFANPSYFFHFSFSF